MGRSFCIYIGHQYKKYKESAVMYESTEPDFRERMYIVMPIQIAKKNRLAFGNKKVKKGDAYLPAFKHWEKIGHFFTDDLAAYSCYRSYGKLPSHA